MEPISYPVGANDYAWTMANPSTAVVISSYCAVEYNSIFFSGYLGGKVPVKDDSIVNVSVPVDLCTTVSQKKTGKNGKSFALLDMEKSTRSSADIRFCLYSSTVPDVLHVLLVGFFISI